MALTAEAGPFRVVSGRYVVEGDDRPACAVCGACIANVVAVRDATGARHEVGLDCVERLMGRAGKGPAKRAMAGAREAAEREAAAREMKRRRRTLAAFRSRLVDRLNRPHTAAELDALDAIDRKLATWEHAWQGCQWEAVEAALALLGADLGAVGG